jgi:hypothetical protein
MVTSLPTRKHGAVDSLLDRVLEPDTPLLSHTLPRWSTDTRHTHA